MIALLASPALAGDFAVTSVGADGIYAASIGVGDVNLALGQRVRWTIVPDVRALVDGRFVVDPVAEVSFEDSRVRELGVAGDTGPVTWRVGRMGVLYGGPRLVDGAQALVHPGRIGLVAGGWVGFVPDEFTTAPTARFGGGPIVAFTRGAATVSAMGDFAQDHAGALFTARGEIGSVVQADGRLDWLLSDALGNSGLMDGAVFLQATPTRGIRLDATWDAYSSLRYQTRAALDPFVQRFSARLEGLGLLPGLTEDQLDPTLRHLVGGTALARASGERRAFAQLRARTLLYPDPAERYTRAGLALGLGGLAGDQLELALDANALSVETGFGGDGGVTFTFEPSSAEALAIDGSARALLDPAYEGGVGVYADLYADLVLGSGTSIAAGASWTNEPSPGLGRDVGIGAFLQVRQWIRRRSEPKPTAQP